MEEQLKLIKKYSNLRNKITWQRDKGRGSNNNWKNNSEEILYSTMSENFTFNVNDIKTKKKVIAPYKENDKPKDWFETNEGNFRYTFPSNFFNDITIPYWSMAENTPHPTQKPEKLLAKLILASSNKNDTILDPFSGSGTTASVCQKLNRNFIAFEIDEYFCKISKKRLLDNNNRIQGYENGYFTERNS